MHLSRVDGILTDHSLLSRLSVSLVGMCAFPHHAGNGCTIFQVSNSVFCMTGIKKLNYCILTCACV